MGILLKKYFGYLPIITLILLSLIVSVGRKFRKGSRGWFGLNLSCNCIQVVAISETTWTGVSVTHQATLPLCFSLSSCSLNLLHVVSPHGLVWASSPWEPQGKGLLYNTLWLQNLRLIKGGRNSITIQYVASEVMRCSFHHISLVTRGWW